MRRHGTQPERARSAGGDATSRRIAELSEEYLEAGPKRRSAISAEVRGLVAGRIEPLPDRRRFAPLR